MFWYYLAVIALFVVIVIVGKKLNVANELEPIRDILIDVIKDVEANATPHDKGEDKFNKAVTIASNRLTEKQHRTIEKSIFGNLPKLLQNVFNAVELLLVLKGGKK